MQHAIYRHTESGVYYRIVDTCFLQVNDEWEPAYIYQEASRSPAIYSPKYCRLASEFHAKFKHVPDTDSQPVGDSSSILELIRATQLWDVLGKHKLF